MITKESIALHSAAGMVETATAIVARKNLLFSSIDLKAVPEKLRAALVQQRIKQLSPFQTTASHSLIQGDWAQVWCWDKSLLQSSISGKELTESAVVQSCPQLPETLFYTPFTTGFRVQACVQGWELQYWQNSILHQSRWLADYPDDQQKNAFVRTSPVAFSDDVIWVENESHFNSRPYDQKEFWSREHWLQESVLSKAILGLLMAFLVFQFSWSLVTFAREAWLSQSIAHEQQELRERVNQREAATNQQEFNQFFIDLLSQPTQLHLLAQIQTCLQGQQYQLLDWQYQQGRLSLLIEQQQPDARALVETCSKNTLFEQVQTEPGPITNQTRLHLVMQGAVSAEGGDDAE